MDKEAQELAAEIEKLDLSGGREGADLPTPEPPAEPAAELVSTPEPEPKPAAEPAAEPEPADAKPATPADAEPVAPADDKPVIPDSHYRAALHMGWKAEEVGELYDQNPALALKTLAKCYEQVNAASKQLGELGQKARQLRAEPAAPAAPQQPSRKEAVKKMLKDEYEDSAALEALVDLIPDQPPTRPQAPVTPEPIQDRQVEVEREIAVRQQINTFFSADEMDVYGDFYGKAGQTGTWETLTPGQKANRLAVCERAQLILDGAAATGTQMSAAEALEMAHLAVSAPMAEQFVRERIAKSVQKRAAGVTLKPSGSKPPAPTGDNYNHQQAVVEVAAKIKEIGIG